MPYSIAQYVGDGSNRLFSVPFPFIKRDHVSVMVAGAGTTYQWLSDGLIQLDAAAPAGALVSVMRNSSRGVRLVDFQDGQSLTSEDLDLANTQAIYVAQEAFDASDLDTVSTGVSGDAINAANSALSASLAATSAGVAKNAAQGYAASAGASAATAGSNAISAAASATAAAASAATVAIYASGPVPINLGGTGSITAQAAVNTLTNVSAATAGFVLTKVGGNAVWSVPTLAGNDPVFGQGKFFRGDGAVTSTWIVDSGYAFRTESAAGGDHWNPAVTSGAANEKNWAWRFNGTSGAFYAYTDAMGTVAGAGNPSAVLLATRSGASIVSTRIGGRVLLGTNPVDDNTTALQVNGGVTLSGTMTVPENSLVAPFKHNATGAVQRAFSTLARREIWVEDFGAVGDYNPATNTGTDDTAAIQAAINAAQSASNNGVVTVRFAAKNYRINSGLVITLTSTAPVVLQGETWGHLAPATNGVAGTRLFSTATGGYAVLQVKTSVAYGTAIGTYVNFQLRDFLIWNRGVCTTGILLGEVGVQIDGTGRSVLENVGMMEFAKGLEVANTRQVEFRRVLCRNDSTAGNPIHIHGTDGTQFTGDLRFHGCEFTAQHDTTSHAVLIANTATAVSGPRGVVAGIHFTDCDFYGGIDGVRIENTSTSDIADIFINKCAFDGAASVANSNGLLVSNSGAGFIRNVVCDGSYFMNYNLGANFYSSSIAHVVGMRFHHNYVALAPAGGVSMDSIVNANISGNSFQRVGSDIANHCCIRVVNGCTVFTISDNTHHYDFNGTGSATLGWLVKIDNTTPVCFTVTNNVGQANTAAVSDASSTGVKTVTGNQKL